MKGRYVFWGMIVSMALGLLVRYCYLNWGDENVRGTICQVAFFYCLTSSFLLFRIKKKEECLYYYVFIPLAWVMVFFYFVIICPIRFINKLADKYLTIEEKEPNK